MVRARDRVAVAATSPVPARDRFTWHVEHDPATRAELTRDARSAMTLRFTLGAGRPANQFAALVGAVANGVARYDRVVFSGRADRPMRIDVELRPRGTDNPPRWQRSVYLDESPRTMTIPFADLRPLPRDVTAPLPLDAVDALMFVVDTNNTPPGTSGVVTIGRVAWGALH